MCVHAKLLPSARICSKWLRKSSGIVKRSMGTTFMMIEEASMMFSTKANVQSVDRHVNVTPQGAEGGCQCLH